MVDKDKKGKKFMAAWLSKLEKITILWQFGWDLSN